MHVMRSRRVTTGNGPHEGSATRRLRAQVATGRTRQGVGGCVKRRPPSEETPFEGLLRPHVVLWLKCRQQEMEDAISSGNQLDVTRLASVMAEGEIQLRTWTQPPSTLGNQI